MRDMNLVFLHHTPCGPSDIVSGIMFTQARLSVLRKAWTKSHCYVMRPHKLVPAHVPKGYKYSCVNSHLLFMCEQSPITYVFLWNELPVCCVTLFCTILHVSGLKFQRALIIETCDVSIIIFTSGNNCWVWVAILQPVSSDVLRSLAWYWFVCEGRKFQYRVLKISLT